MITASQRQSNNGSPRKINQTLKLYIPLPKIVAKNTNAAALKTCYDLYSLNDIDIVEHIKDNIDNIVIIDPAGANALCFRRTWLKNLLTDATCIFYPCINNRGVLPKPYKSMVRIYSNNINVVVPLQDINYAITTDVKRFKLYETDITHEFTVSHDVAFNGGTRIGADHCQSGTNKLLHRLLPLPENNAKIKPQIKNSRIIEIAYSRTITENLSPYDKLINPDPTTYSTPKPSFIFKNNNLEIIDFIYDNGFYTIVKYTFTNILKSNIPNAINDGFNNDKFSNDGFNNDKFSNDGFFEVELTSDGNKIFKLKQKQPKTIRDIDLDITGNLIEDNVWVTEEIKDAIKQTALIFNANNQSSIRVFELVAQKMTPKNNSGGARNKIGSLESLTVKELIVRAKAKQIAYSGLKKIDLIARIRQKGSKKVK